VASVSVTTRAETPAIVDQEPRCWRCNRLLAYFLARPWRLKCERCNAVNGNAPETE
jgi:phage FluMu protein Com